MNVQACRDKIDQATFCDLYDPFFIPLYEGSSCSVQGERRPSLGSAVMDSDIVFVLWNPDRNYNIKVV